MGRFARRGVSNYGAVFDSRLNHAWNLNGLVRFARRGARQLIRRGGEGLHERKTAAMLRLKVALSNSVESARLAQERSDAVCRQNLVNMLDPRQGAGNIGEPDDGASLDDNEECERRMRPFRKGDGVQPSSNSCETAAYCHDETSRDDKDSSSSHLCITMQPREEGGYAQDPSRRAY